MSTRGEGYGAYNVTCYKIAREIVARDSPLALALPARSELDDLPYEETRSRNIRNVNSRMRLRKSDYADSLVYIRGDSWFINSFHLPYSEIKY